ncbi:hypothetical protein BC831DRAFT_456026 [Entophlyctis helioformis]|nr:hypothetical protein BC831DRAFT_456026 [Entophlyctis helioformis]
MISLYNLPFKLGFAMTVHESQGLQLKCVGVDLQSRFFDHGMLYTAASRVSHPSNIRFATPKTTTTNFVFTTVLV